MKWMIGIVSAVGISVLSIGLALLFVGSDSSIAGPDENVSASNGLSTAINVHGDWSIDVINPDGTLAVHREASNDLTNLGKSALKGVLGGTGVFGDWQIVLQGDGENGDPVPSRIVENFSVFTEPLPATTVKNLTRGSTGSLELKGSFNAVEDGSIGWISTEVSYCGMAFVVVEVAANDEFIWPSVCHNKNLREFSGTYIEPTTLLKDQKVNISVVYTFD